MTSRKRRLPRASLPEPQRRPNLRGLVREVSLSAARTAHSSPGPYRVCTMHTRAASKILWYLNTTTPHRSPQETPIERRVIEAPSASVRDATRAPAVAHYEHEPDQSAGRSDRAGCQDLLEIWA